MEVINNSTTTKTLVLITIYLHIKILIKDVDQLVKTVPTQLIQDKIRMTSIIQIPKQVLEWLAWVEASLLNLERRTTYQDPTKPLISANRLIIIQTIIMVTNQVKII